MGRWQQEEDNLSKRITSDLNLSDPNLSDPNLSDPNKKTSGLL